MLLKEETHKIQSELAWYCREGKLVDIEGANSDRLPHYRRLVYNVVYGVMEKAFPIANEQLTVPEFKGLVQHFLTKHNAVNPQVWKLPGEFYEFVTQNPTDAFEKHPHLSDLMKMEWTEILVYNRENRPIPETKPIKDLHTEALVINPDFELLDLNYAVFRKTGEEKEHGDYRLLLFRNTETKKVHFIEISPLHQILIAGMLEGNSIQDLTEAMSEKLQIQNPGEFQSKIEAFAQRLVTEGFILGAASGTS